MIGFSSFDTDKQFNRQTDRQTDGRTVGRTDTKEHAMRLAVIFND